MDTVKSLLSPFGVSSGSLNDTLKLVVIGGTVETARRASMSAWNGFVDSFFLTAHFSQEDYPYDWLMHWLSKQPAWGRSREFDITTRTVGRSSVTQTTTGDLKDDMDDDKDSLLNGQKQRTVAFMPSPDTTHTIFYRGHWLRITRTKRFQEYGHCSELKISVVARNNNILKQLVLEAKREYEKDAEHRVHIFMADTTYGCWRWNGARQKRRLSSIVLEPGVKDMLLADCRDFLHSEDWYAERGIPFRRGYLLHGVPGSGKTSLIHSLAGELGLDIYVVSLSSKGMSDNTLTTLMGLVPSRCILLLEDLDAAFTRGVSRDEKSTGMPLPHAPALPGGPKNPAENTTNDGSTLSLSGLLNSLDGVAAAEGRLLFATTNHIERLDPALSRPGRMDVWVNFKNATRWQAEGIFKNFFPSKPTGAATPDPSTPSSPSFSTPTTPTTEAELGVPKRRTHLIPALEESELCALAKRFADQIPEDELSVAALQGYLLKNKTRPREAVDEVSAWIIQERETRAKLKKEKEEREAKEKKEAAERVKKEREELEARERADREAKEREEKAREKSDRKDSRNKSRRKRSEPTALLPAAPPPPLYIETTLPAIPVPIPAPKAEESDSSGSSPSSTNYETDSGNDEADSEASATSEDDTVARAATEAATAAATKEKWVAVKGQQQQLTLTELVPAVSPHS